MFCDPSILHFVDSEANKRELSLHNHTVGKALTRPWEPLVDLGAN